ncbi:MAG: hypothetical protein FWF06_06305 [Symbiobacteriaceae bacterium]|nr:hypothetical protein [Symbiobacteriaceae bacterium]
MNKKYYWVTCTLEELRDLLQLGQAIFFHFNGNDYFVERSRGGYYLIQDPQIDSEGSSSTVIPYTDYPGNMEANTPDAFLALPFLEGRSIIECFSKIKFFDV